MKAIKQKAFTLIELLVVISIIALLVAILMPALGKAKEQAKNVVCRTNIRSLAMGFKLYAASNDDKVFSNTYKGNQTLWLDYIGNQVDKVDEVRFCPTTKINPNQPPLNQWLPAQLFGDAKQTWIWPFGVEELEHGSYGYNGYLYANKGDAAYWNSATPKNASSIPLFTDCRWVDSWPNSGDVCPVGFDLSSGGNGNMMQRFLISRHADKLNMGFLDGHVEPIELKMLWSLKWSRTFQTKGAQMRSDGTTPIYK